MQNVDDVRDLAKAITFVESEVGSDGVVRMWRGCVAANIDIRHFGDAFIEAFIVGFGQQIYERQERCKLENFAPEGTGILGATDVTFDFVTNQHRHLVAVGNPFTGNDEERPTTFSLVAGINRLDLGVKHAFPGRLETVVFQYLVKRVADVGGFEAAFSERGNLDLTEP